MDKPKPLISMEFFTSINDAIQRSISVPVDGKIETCREVERGGILSLTEWVELDQKTPASAFRLGREVIVDDVPHLIYATILTLDEESCRRIPFHAPSPSLQESSARPFPLE